MTAGVISQIALSELQPRTSRVGRFFASSGGRAPHRGLRSAEQREPLVVQGCFRYRFRLFGLQVSRLHQYTDPVRSEEHTSELQSRENLVCRLLLEKKKQQKNDDRTNPN